MGDEARTSMVDFHAGTVDNDTSFLCIMSLGVEHNQPVGECAVCYCAAEYYGVLCRQVAELVGYLFEHFIISFGLGLAAVGIAVHFASHRKEA